MRAPSLRVAYYTAGTRKSGPFITITLIGHSFVGGEQHPVGGKRDARKLCAALGVKPWNF